MIQEATSRPTRGNAEAPANTPSDPMIALSQSAHAATCPRELYGDAMRLLAESFHAVYAAVHVPDAAQPLTDYWHRGADAPQFWQQPANEALDGVLAQARPSARLYGAADSKLRVAFLAVPLLDTHRPGTGGLVLVVPCIDRNDAQTKLTRLRAITDTLPLLATSIDQRRARSRDEAQTADPNQNDALAQVANPLLEALGSASGAKTLRQLAFTVTNNLRAKLGCDVVALGQVRGKKINVLSISGFAELSPRSPGVTTIASSMEEALDAGTTLVAQAGGFNDQDELRNRLHAAWRRSANDAAVASIPLRLDDKVVAVISLRQPPHQAFDTEQLTRIEQAVTPYAAALVMVERATATLPTQIARGVKATTKAVFLPRSAPRAVIYGLLAALTIWFAFGSMSYRVHAICSVTPAVYRQVTTPFDGRIAEAFFMPGDAVKAGDLLAELDTTDLRRQHDQLASQYEVQRIALDRALAESDTGQVRVASAELRAIGIELQAAAALLHEARIVAPADGIVVEGDLQTLVGQPVSRGTPLYRIAENDGMRLEMAVPDHASSSIGTGLAGRFALDARPDAGSDLRIARIRPAAEVREGKNVFIAEADVSDAPDWVRPGMQGVAKIEAGERPVWWITLHRAVDWFRLKFWV
ncbi:MAG: HlyD family efflux transporter periplasmic adaptor subunit [Planctomycetota bacterium]